MSLDTVKTAAIDSCDLDENLQDMLQQQSKEIAILTMALDNEQLKNAMINNGNDEIRKVLIELVSSMISYQNSDDSVRNFIIEVFRKSKLIESAWYLQINPDVASAGSDPIEHYIDYGWLEGRSPNRYLNVKQTDALKHF